MDSPGLQRVRGERRSAGAGVEVAVEVEAGAAGRGEAVGLHGLDLAVGLLPVVAAAGSPQGGVLATKGSGNARHRRCQSKKM